MHSKFTPKKMMGLYRIALMVFSFIAFSLGTTNAQFYSNGPLSTGATSSNGTAAPAGFTWSEVQAGNTNAGFGANITANLTLADNFTVVGTWALTKITFYAYSTGFTGATSPFNDVRLRIFNTDPSVGNPTPVYGDLTTNRFAASASADMYRIFNAAPGTTRKIWAVEATVNTTLTAGTYWLEWQLGNGGISNFSPSVTIVGQVTQPGWNAKQHDLTAGTWINLVDGTNAQDMPFRIDYTTSGCTGTPAPGATVTSSASVCPGGAYTLSVANATPGSGVTYQWQSATSLAGPYTNIAGATNATYSTTMTNTTYYQLVVTCSGNNGTSTPVEVALAPTSSCYCTPPTSNCNLGDIITNVTLGTLNNTSTCGTNGYTNYTSTVAATNLIQGATNPMSVTVGNGGTEYVGVWIDYDKSGSFDASEFTLLGSGNGTTINGNITVPLTAQLGETRMRVRVRWLTTLTGANACLGYTYGETEDYKVNIIPCVQGSITAQPVNRTIGCGGNTTFAVTAVGSALNYQWEYRTSATAPWQLVTNGGVYSGATTPTLTITGATGTMGGYQYRVVYSGACTAPDFSNSATLTINPLTATVNVVLPISVCNSGAPIPISITNPSGATTTSTFASNPALNIPIPDNGTVAGINNTINVTTIPAGVSVTGLAVKLNITHSWVGDLIIVLKAPNGKIINLSAAIGSTGGPGPSTGFTNTVISSVGVNALTTGTSPYTGIFRADARITPIPSLPPYTNVAVGPTGYLPDAALWSDLYSQGNGNWTLALYDYYQDNLSGNQLVNWSLDVTYGSLATGIFTPSTGLYTDAAGTIPYTGTAVNTVYADPTESTTYSLVVNTPTCTSAPLSIPITVNNPIVGTSATNNVGVCTDGDASFTASAPTSGNNIQHQWQVSTDNGASWTNVTNTGVYTGATSATLNISGAMDDMNGYLYRDSMYVTSCNSFLNSTPGMLTVNPNPVLVLSANPFTQLAPGMTTTLSVAVSPNPGATYTWYRNGIVVPNATGNTLVVDVDALGEYTVSVDDINACNNMSNAITITDLPSSNVFIYPSPNTGQFQVRYHSAPGNILPRMLNIYDSKGARIYSRSYPIGTPYERMDVDLSRHGKGIYMVELADRNGARLKTARVLVL